MGEVLIANECMIWKSIHKYIKNPDALAKIYNLEKDDILQIGRIAFIKALKAFDTKRGVKFSSFAVTAIYREVRHYLRSNFGIIKITRGAQQLIHKLKRIEDEYGYLPQVSELAILLDKSPKKVEALLRVKKTVRSLDEYQPKHDSEDTTMDIFDDQDIQSYVVDKIDTDNLIDSIKHHLTEKELLVLRSMLTGTNQTCTAKKYGTSSIFVSRTVKKVKELLLEVKGDLCYDTRND
jgi:RNA polymerase sigma factor (sigma-70 family)